jgi:hypothetical protein
MISCDTILFLGFPLSDSYQQMLDELPLGEREIFIQRQASPYLQQIESEGKRYLGKFLGASIEMAALESIQSHIYSILKKLVPCFPYEAHPILILAIPAQQASIA